MADICGVDQVDGEKKSVVISSVSQLTNILRLSSLSLRRFRAAAGGGTGGHGYGDSNASGSSISLSSNAPALQSYGYTALVGSDENVNARTSVHDATNAALLQPSATGEQHFVDPFLEESREADSDCNAMRPSTAAATAAAAAPVAVETPSQFWLSSDLLRQHSQQLDSVPCRTLLPVGAPLVPRLAQASDSSSSDVISDGSGESRRSAPSGDESALEEAAESTAPITSSSAKSLSIGSASPKTPTILSRFSPSPLRDCHVSGLCSTDAQAESSV